MNIIRAKNAGFCFGVKRAIESVRDILNKSNNIVYSIGPLIHNEKVTDELREKGLKLLTDENKIINLKNEKVIIRTHGIEKKLFDNLRKNNNEIVDLTCPFVKKIQELVYDYSKNGYKVIVIGDRNHPEVRAVMSYANNDIYVVICEEDIRKLDLPRDSHVLVVFQTTTNVENSKKLVDILNNLFYNIKVIDTICNATENRQVEVFELAKVCDVMLIIGSKNSSNTKKLYEISKKFCENSYILNDIVELNNINIKNSDKVGISAGASTPDYLIEEILNNARDKF